MLWFRSLLYGILLLILVVLDRTFFPGMFGGSWAVSTVFCVALVRMVTFGSQKTFFWSVYTATLIEIFSKGPFGGMFLSVFAGLVLARIAVYGVFSHRSFIARIVCATIGVLVAVVFLCIYRLLFSIVTPNPTTSVDVQALWHGGLLQFFWTTCTVVLMLIVLAPIERRFQWIFINQQARKQILS